MNTKVSSSLACAIALTFASATASAADGTINFFGTIIETGCNISVNGSGTSNGNVDLGKVARSAFTGVGSTVDGVASSTGFTIELSKCPLNTPVTLKFDGENVDGNDQILAVTKETGAATGVGIQLYDKDRNVIQLASATTSTDIVEGQNILPFYAKYIQTAENVTAGPANSVATFTVNY